MNEDIIVNLASVRERIAAAAERAGRDAGDVTLIGVSKTHPAQVVEAAWRAGLRDFAENRVQEASAKMEEFRLTAPQHGDRPRWHMVGHMQRNKAAAAIHLFDIIHSIDSERIALALDEGADRANRRPAVLVEVNVTGESSKQGVDPTEVKKLVERIGALSHLNLLGLMTVAPQADDPEDVRPVFKTLRELRDSAGLSELSMGMTDDFEIAIEEGATMVRVGRAIFGLRGLAGAQNGGAA